MSDVTANFGVKHMSKKRSKYKSNHTEKDPIQMEPHYGAGRYNTMCARGIERNVSSDPLEPTKLYYG
jgi:hypothetical protein